MGGRTCSRDKTRAYVTVESVYMTPTWGVQEMDIMYYRYMKLMAIGFAAVAFIPVAYMYLQKHISTDD
jgi:hypothetical protein